VCIGTDRVLRWVWPPRRNAVDRIAFSHGVCEVLGMAWQAMSGQARSGRARSGAAWFGEAWFGEARVKGRLTPPLSMSAQQQRAASSIRRKHKHDTGFAECSGELVQRRCPRCGRAVPLQREQHSQQDEQHNHRSGHEDAFDRRCPRPTGRRLGACCSCRRRYNTPSCAKSRVPTVRAMLTPSAARSAAPDGCWHPRCR
jgi:hypothetical protein